MLTNTSFNSPVTPLNLPALEAIETMTGYVPDEVRDQILTAPLSDDLSGLRVLANRLWIPDGWAEIRKPKQEIGEYVESYGFKVPKRYESLEEAMSAVQSGITVYMRSEHPREYDGFSGLLRTYGLQQNRIHDRYFPHESQTFKRIFQGMDFEDVEHEAKWDDIRRLPMQRYLRLSRMDEGEFYDDMAFSYWEYIPGKNITVVADDSIEERYHITVFGNNNTDGGIYLPNGQSLIEQPKEYSDHLDLLDPNARASIIDAYEQIRKLPRFSPRICPIMELQLDDNGAIWFLQYHKARPFRQAPETLSPDDYPEAEGWHKADTVRGALGTFVTLKTALRYPTPRSGPNYIPDETEEASFDFHYDVGFSEFIARNRIAYLSQKGSQRQYFDMADGAHELRNRWFKTHGALALGKQVYENLLSSEQHKSLSQLIRQGQMARFVLDIASDGRTGFVRLTPDAEQPLQTAK